MQSLAAGTTTYNTSSPTSTDVANWTTGWGTTNDASHITGWNYVGQVNGAGGVYLGNGWVLTAAHVGGGDFTLAGTTYSMIANSTQSVTNSSGTADFVLFKISTTLTLPALTISSTAPSTGTFTKSADTVVMIGYGGGAGETWGANSVSGKNQSVTPQGYSYVSTDFYTTHGTYIGTYGRSYTNNAEVVGEDSGGGDFIYNSSTSSWELAGINEAVDSSGGSYMIQLSTYSSQINTIITTVPEPATTSLFGLGLLLGLRRRR
ncbi:MAG: trypsin-like peptidase domain-containing protein [Chthoniobacteraceae bacterium]